MTKKAKKTTKAKAQATASEAPPSDQVPPVPSLSPGEYPLNVSQARHKVAILGTTPHRQQAPFDDPTWQIWGVGPSMHDMISNSSGVVRRFDRWLEVHNPDDWVKGHAATEHSKDVYLPWLRSIGPKAMILRAHAVLPDATVIDAERIIKTFGAESYGFIRGSIEWCIAIALLDYHIDQPGQLEAVGMWGVDYASSEERRTQKNGVRHWMDKCRTFGVSVHLPAGSDLNATPKAYPFYEETPLHRKSIFRLKELNSRIAEKTSTAEKFRKDLRAVEDELQQLSGALQDTQYWQANDWM